MADQCYVLTSSYYSYEGSSHDFHGLFSTVEKAKAKAKAHAQKLFEQGPCELGNDGGFNIDLCVFDAPEHPIPVTYTLPIQPHKERQLQWTK